MATTVDAGEPRPATVTPVAAVSTRPGTVHTAREPAAAADTSNTTPPPSSVRVTHATGDGPLQSAADAATASAVRRGKSTAPAAGTA